MQLASTQINTYCCVRKMPKIPLLEALGVRTGVKLQVVGKQPLKGPIVVRWAIATSLSIEE